MSEAIQRRLAAFRERDRVQARSLIITAFGDAVLPRGGRIWLGSLIRLLAPLGLNERLIRTSVFRLAKDEWLRGEAHGRRSEYLLTAAGRRRFEEASRQIYASAAPQWDRRWRLILTVGELDSRALSHVRRALDWQGFGRLGADVFVHPSADLASAFDALVVDGLGDVLGKLMPLIAADSSFGLSASGTDLVARAWALESLAADYSTFVGHYSPMLDELRLAPLDDLEPESAFLARMLLIHDYRRLLLRDPELPVVLLPADWPGYRARLLVKELYRRLLAASETHLDAAVSLADGARPEALAVLDERFRDDDPLTVGGFGSERP